MISSDVDIILFDATHSPWWRVCTCMLREISYEEQDIVAQLTYDCFVVFTKVQHIARVLNHFSESNQVLLYASLVGAHPDAPVAIAWR